MTTKDNPGTLPINLYAVGPPNDQPLDLTKLGEPAVQPLSPLPQETTECLYKSNQIVCVQGDKADSDNSLVLACRQENAKVGMKKVKAKMFVQDPFNPICLFEDSEKYVEVYSIMCILTSYKHHQHVLELKEEELILLQDEIQQTSDILTLTEAMEISTDELGVSDVARHSSRRRKRRFAEDYLYYE